MMTNAFVTDWQMKEATDSDDDADPDPLAAQLSSPCPCKGQLSSPVLCGPCKESEGQI